MTTEARPIISESPDGSIGPGIDGPDPHDPPDESTPWSFRLPLQFDFGDQGLSDALLLLLSAANRELRLERSAEGILEIMPLCGALTSHRNANLTYRLSRWTRNEGRGLGVCFGSCVGFSLPNGACRSPDCSWLAIDRWQALTPEQREAYPPYSPDFVAELRSEGDRKATLRAKMREYLDNGARLGWLIDPLDGTVEIYRPGREPGVLRRPDRLDGEDVLPGFVLELNEILFD